MLNGYRIAIFFLVAVILFDIFSGTVSGFTFGYAGALFYYTMRYREIQDFYHHMEENDEEDVD